MEAATELTFTISQICWTQHKNQAWVNKTTPNKTISSLICSRDSIRTKIYRNNGQETLKIGSTTFESQKHQELLIALRKRCIIWRSWTTNFISRQWQSGISLVLLTCLKADTKVKSFRRKTIQLMSSKIIKKSKIAFSSNKGKTAILKMQIWP